ncbi:hypothetical protein BGZ47_005915 [Haplosporangium gracile]|nr:hypothetical protein BGZ47_005915 [Haplosporangium gracile]
MERNSTAITSKHDRTTTNVKRPKSANIPYEVFERAQQIKPLGNNMVIPFKVCLLVRPRMPSNIGTLSILKIGSAIVLTSQTSPLIRQLGLEEEFNFLNKVLTTINVGKENRQIDFEIVVGSKDAVKRFGSETRLIARPVLYDLLLRQTPKERVHLGKKILTTKQGGNGVLIRCSDGTEYEGGILAGADGAHSVVRQNLYAVLKEENKLPQSDGEALPFISVCLVGQTRPLIVEEYPDIEKEECQFNCVVGEDKPYAWGVFTTAQRIVAYSLVEFLLMETSKDDETFSNSEWGSEAATAMCEQVRDFPIIAGGDKKFTVGNLIDWTPKEYISQVMLEEKIFQTWGSCRTALLGDACHKFNPSGGAGATNAMHDAVIFANYIDALPDHATTDDIEKAFLAYKSDRIQWVEDVFEQSKLFRSMVNRKAIFFT